MKRLLERSPDVLWVLDADSLRFLYVSPSVERLRGYSVSEIMTQTLDGALEPAARDRVRALADERTAALREGTLPADFFDRVEVPQPRRDGSIVWTEVITSLWLDPESGAVEIHGVTRDITQRRAAEARARANAERFQRLLEQAPNLAVQGYGVDRRVVFWNQASEALYGYSAAEALGQRLEDLIIPPPMRAGVIEAHTRWVKDGIPIPSGALVLCRKDGSPVPVFSSHAIDGEGDASPVMYCMDVDLSALRAAEHRARLAASVFAHSAEGILVLDEAEVILEANAAAEALVGAAPGALVGRSLSTLLSRGHAEVSCRRVRAAVAKDGHWGGDLWLVRPEGREGLTRTRLTLVEDSPGAPAYRVVMLSDISAQWAQEERLRYVATHDPLTGLANRVLLVERLQRAMVRVDRGGGHLAVVFLDLDGFKPINDAHGHAAGDALLISVAKRLRAAVRGTDTVARIGGDEFVLVFTDLERPERLMPQLDRILQVLRAPIPSQGGSLAVSGSLGVTFYPQEGTTESDSLLRQADQAMYQAKLEGRDRVAIFDAAQDARLQSRQRRVTEVGQAIAQGALRLHYQPKIDLRTGAVVALEALVRWDDPTHGLRQPAEFLPQIAGHAVEIALGEWVIREALAQASRWRGRGIPLMLSLNVAGAHLQHEDFVPRLRGMLAKHPDLPAGAIGLEVLESSAIDRVDRVAEVLSACAALGVPCALDDFGTGFSSLSYLKRLPVQVIKIDRSFVQDILCDPDDLAIVEGIIGMAGAFGRKVVAEGVESIPHGVLLGRLGCDTLQGYAIARPMPPEAIPEWLAAWSAPPEWLEVQPAPVRLRPLFRAQVHHRAWVGALTRSLNGQGPPPALDRGECVFGGWLQALTEVERSGLGAWLPEIELIHARVHALGAELLTAGGDPGPFEAAHTALSAALEAVVSRAR